MAEEIQFMPGSVGYATYGPQETLTLPYYGLGLAAVTAAENTAQAVTHDALPWVRWGFTEAIAFMPRMAKSEWSRASSSNVGPIM